MEDNLNIVVISAVFIEEGISLDCKDKLIICLRGIQIWRPNFLGRNMEILKGS